MVSASVLRANDAYMKITLGTLSVTGEWASLLASVNVTDSLEALDSVQVTFDVPQGDIWDTKAKKLNLYAKEYKIELMRGSAPVRTLVGDILEISWTRAAGSPRTCTITGIDYLHRLGRERAKPAAGDRSFSGKKISDVVQTVAKEYSLATSGVTATDADLGQFVASKPDDLTLLKELADQAGYVFRVDAKGGSKSLVFAKATAYASETVELEFGVDILSVDATHSLNGVLTEVTVSTKDASKGDPAKPQTVKASTIKGDAVNSGGLFGPDLMNDIGAVKQVTADDKGEGKAPKAKEVAEGALRAAAKTFVKGSLECRFTPELACGKKVKIKGAGWPLDGTFVVSEVKHSLDRSGYRTTVSFEADSLQKP